MDAVSRTASSAALPELRQDLRLYEGPHDDTRRSWLVYDPVRHRYYMLARPAFELLGMWQPGSAEELAERSSAVLKRTVSVTEVRELARFIVANNLSLEPAGGDFRALARQHSAARYGPVARVLHHYLFFKVPIARPDRFLKATLPLVAPLFSRTTALSIGLVWLVGLYLALRQWEAFVATFMEFLNAEGALFYASTLVGIKILHEFGHAYAATRAGVRVNTMGIAFMLLTPILYTDVTDAWRLRDRRQKLVIDSAGIIVELGLAGLALFVWAFLPDGLLRSAAFVTATTSLMIGLVVNLNPFMRFDGYHLLADAWGVPNLHARSSALATWWMREQLFGLESAPPEQFDRLQRRLLIAFAVCCWIYRFVLFLGIALVVYFMFFKALGVVLFVVEIGWFIVLPVVGEITQWWKMRAQIRARGRVWRPLAGLALGLAVVFVPWSATVVIQAVAIADQETVIYAPLPARVMKISITEGRTVATGEELIRLAAPDLEHDLSKTQLQIALTQLRLDRIAGDDQDRSQRVVLIGELARHRANLTGLEAEGRRLRLVAPHAGVLRDVDPELGPGEWIDNLTPIARVVGTVAAQIRGYVSEDDVWRIAAGARVTFVPEDPQLPARTGRIEEIAPTGVQTVEVKYLSSAYGGAIISDRTNDAELKPRSGLHLVRGKLDGPAVGRVLRGRMHIAGARESIAAAVWRRVLRVLVREVSA